MLHNRGEQCHFATRYLRPLKNGLTKDFIEDYLCIDGKPISLSNQYKGDANLVDEMTNRDPRFAQTITYQPNAGFWEGPPAKCP
ncbi:MAG: RagB/SusD family nutrient uptake outer membrane protein, partial [Colwellia sp.]|nr:RagB/SusD family nutrient uptake outer membrane protein [Colwellia sp.]